MDWSALEVGYVVSAYAISAVGVLGMIGWCLWRGKVAAAALRKRND